MATLRFAYSSSSEAAVSIEGPHDRYTELEWQADVDRRRRGFVQPCPACGRTEWFAPVSQPGPGGRDVHLRACRVCGFYQRADGASPPARAQLAVHVCLGRFTTSRKCGGCGTEMRAGQPWHLCAWLLDPGEVRSCPECQARIETAHIVPWAVQRG